MGNLPGKYSLLKSNTFEVEMYLSRNLVHLYVYLFLLINVSNNYGFYFDHIFKIDIPQTDL